MPNIRTIAQKTAVLLTTLLLASLATAGRAAEEQRYYDIELVIFQNTEALKTLPELNRDPQPLKLPEHYIQLGMPVATEATDFIPDYYFKLLPSTDYKLADAAAKIAASRSYRIIKHIAWRQPGLDKSIAIPVFFQDTILPDMPEATAGTEPAPPLYTHASLDGVITVSLSRYLHLESELRFQVDGLAPLPITETTAPVAETDPTAVAKPRPTTVVYVSKQTRKMRSKELHYIDHPVFGMLVLMTPVEIPKDKLPPAR